ncbi:hypothetical protein [Devosia ginsengisoli]|uniref:hypothetical protein n=1 Tax=Devosia ginsengisoli TaxID=400770 RepID=UPI0026F2E306|nr:hypothetical protein [Devosia ginsengisoli]MCR6670027.1 hypothetical protein [Devosia ginsengisoli]
MEEKTWLSRYSDKEATQLVERKWANRAMVQDDLSLEPGRKFMEAVTDANDWEVIRASEPSESGGFYLVWETVRRRA